jgi:hypothetical protein
MNKTQQPARSAKHSNAAGTPLGAKSESSAIDANPLTNVLLYACDASQSERRRIKQFINQGRAAQ